MNAKFVLALAALVGGCAHRPAVLVTLPEIGAVATEGVGENLLLQGTGLLQQTLIVPRDQQVGSFTLHKGQYMQRSENAELVRFDDYHDTDGKKWRLDLKKTDKTICIGKDQCAAIEYSLKGDVGSKQRNWFQQTLLYNGKVGNKIVLAYREFSGGLARPAFSNEVTYDLGESRVIGYKGARIEVIDATNTEITYKVLSGFQ